MKFDKFKIASVVVIILIIFLVGVIIHHLLFSYRFSIETSHTFIVSNEKKVETLLKEFSNKETFFVSPAILESNPFNVHLSNSSNVAIVILTANDVNVVQLIRILNEGGQLAYCNTNFGDIKTEVKLSAEECSNILNSVANNQLLILINQPNNLLPKTQIIVSKNKAEINLKTYEGAGFAVFELLEKVFPNSKDALDKANKLTRSLH